MEYEEQIGLVERAQNIREKSINQYRRLFVCDAKKR